MMTFRVGLLIQASITLLCHREPSICVHPAIKTSRGGPSSRTRIEFTEPNWLMQAIPKPIRAK